MVGGKKKKRECETETEKERDRERERDKLIEKLSEGERERANLSW